MLSFLAIAGWTYSGWSGHSERHLTFQESIAVLKDPRSTEKMLRRAANSIDRATQEARSLIENAARRAPEQYRKDYNLILSRILRRE